MYYDYNFIILYFHVNYFMSYKHTVTKTNTITTTEKNVLNLC